MPVFNLIFNYMQIHFIKQFPWGEKSHFIEKIWAGFAINDFLWNKRDDCWATEGCGEKWPYGDDSDGVSSWFRPFMKSKPKIHTIREDLKDRWQPEKIIHFEQWTEKPYRSKCYHFAPLIPCVSTQKIVIEYNGLKQTGNVIPAILIDGKYLDRIEFKKLAQNDGFDSESDFFRWFDKDFLGKIIHWTDCRY